MLSMASNMFSSDLDGAWQRSLHNYLTNDSDKDQYLQTLDRVADAALSKKFTDVGNKVGKPLSVLSRFLNSVKNPQNDNAVKNLAKTILSSKDLIKQNYQDQKVSWHVNLEGSPVYQQLQVIDPSLTTLVALGILLTPTRPESQSQLVTGLQEIKNLTDDTKFQDAIKYATTPPPPLTRTTHLELTRDSTKHAANSPSHSSCCWVSGALAAVSVSAAALWAMSSSSNR